MKIIHKFAVILSLITILLFSFAGCREYSYYYHFSVDGENGVIALQTSDSFNPMVYACSGTEKCTLNCSSESFFIEMAGGKKGAHKLTFIAVPDEGYQIKEWVVNGKVVKGNKTNMYTVNSDICKNYNAVICVRFEPIT